jgi:hypothetical protein
LIGVRGPSAVRPQQVQQQPLTANKANALSCTFIDQPTQLTLANLQVTESGLQANSSART